MNPKTKLGVSIPFFAKTLVSCRQLAPRGTKLPSKRILSPDLRSASAR